jgi:hypothetical protein
VAHGRQDGKDVESVVDEVRHTGDAADGGGLQGDQQQVTEAVVVEARRCPRAA